MREGTHTFYILHARPISRADYQSKWEFKAVEDSKWFHASQDAFGFPDGHDAWQQTGWHGWLDLDKAKKALEWARGKKEYETKDGYSNIISRTKYEFRLCEIFSVRRDRVLDL